MTARGARASERGASDAREVRWANGAVEARRGGASAERGGTIRREERERDGFGDDDGDGGDEASDDRCGRGRDE